MAIKQFNVMLITVVTLSSLIIFACGVSASVSTSEDFEEPKALPVASAKSADTGAAADENNDLKLNDGPKVAATTSELNRGGEIWKENDGEVDILTRNERGAKNNNNNNGGSGSSGKKRKNKQEKNKMHAVDAKDTVTQKEPLKEKKNKKSHNPTLSMESEQSSCRYMKSAWTECDPKSNTRSRTLTLKKGEDDCVPTRTIQKKCKKACRYEKGGWSECSAGQMSRTDKLKTASDTTCESSRIISKNCNPGKGGNKGDKSANKEQRSGKSKDKGNRKSRV